MGFSFLGKDFVQMKKKIRGQSRRIRFQAKKKEKKTGKIQRKDKKKTFGWKTTGFALDGTRRRFLFSRAESGLH